ncbi:hypothetical protein LSM04_000300 [Trypanosoma melophagium]|uniref:uncharacterized protein n=1 Tax=Trypanosoma melophagium TaxID=715481 RepID=UPI00351A6C60|nr:hypothetical protein LSM04_000300 [Trypanosoma melophagium]
MFQRHNGDEHFGVRVSANHRKNKNNNKNHNNNNTVEMQQDDTIIPPPPRRTTTRGEGGGGVVLTAAAIETSTSTRETTRHVAGAGAHVPLRSRTMIGPRLQLRTYHDDSELRAALERLKQSCGASSLNEAEELAALQHIHDGSDPAWSQLNRIPGHVIIYCFSFCDMSSLAVLASVNRRLSALANAHHLWQAHAQALGIPIRDAAHAKEDIRLAFQQQEEREEAEVQRHEREYEELERRLVERTAADRILPLDVDAALLTARNNVNNITSGNRNRHNNNNNNNNNRYNIFSSNSNNSNSRGGGNNNTDNTSGNRIRRTAAEERVLREQLEQIESMKMNILRSINEIKYTLETQERQIQQLEQRLEIPQRSQTENSFINESNALTLADIQSFERRICQILLRPVSDLPVILRRGIEDFSTMELLCLYGGGDLGQLVRQRWAAFKRFFPPLSRDYVAVRQALLLPSSSNNNNNNNNTTSSRLQESFACVGGMIRRVQMMSDSEIVKIVM